MRQTMKYQYKILVKISTTVFASLLLLACQPSQESKIKVQKDNHKNTPISKINKNWQLVWQDEFDQPDIDSTKWSFEENCYGGGNDEQQCYTAQSKNAYISNGILNIIAIKEDFTGSKQTQDSKDYNKNDTRTLPFTSARLRTIHKGDWRYGRFEIRAKLPFGQGTWPAIWMLPTDWVYGGWASSGEIDIMEAVNLKTLSDDKDAKPKEIESRIHGTLHYGDNWPNNVYSGAPYKLPNNANPADDFHTYAIEWQAGEIRWYVDNIHYATQRADGWYSQNSPVENAPFNQKFHLILNLAVGGNWAGKVNDKGIDNSVFPQKMAVDFVRVYQCSVDLDSGKGCESIDKNARIVKGKKHAKAKKQ